MATPAWTAPPPRPVVPPAPFAPPVLPYRDDTPIPTGYHVEESHPSGLILGGLLTFGVAYGYAVGSAAAGGFEKGEGWLAVPIFGPWLALTNRETPCGGLQEANDFNQGKKIVQDCLDEVTAEGVRMVVIAFDGVLQLLGGGILMAGIITKNKQLVRNDIAPDPASTPQAWLRAIRPRAIGRSGAGLGVGVSF